MRKCFSCFNNLFSLQGQTKVSADSPTFECSPTPEARRYLVGIWLQRVTFPAAQLTEFPATARVLCHDYRYHAKKEQSPAHATKSTDQINKRYRYRLGQQSVSNVEGQILPFRNHQTHSKFFFFKHRFHKLPFLLHLMPRLR